MSRAGSRMGSANQRATPAADSTQAPPRAAARSLINFAMRPASSTVGTTSSGTRTQLLAPDVRAPEDAHPRALVESRGAGRVLTVDAECSHRLTPLGKAAEALLKQRQPESPAPPGGPDAEKRDQAPVTEALLIVDRGRCDLTAVPDDEDQLRVELRHTEHTLRPGVVIALLVAPLVDERLVQSVLQLSRVAVGVERPQLQAVGPGRRRNPRLEVDDH